MVADEIIVPSISDYEIVMRGVMKNIGFESFVDDLSSVDNKGLNHQGCDVLIRINKYYILMTGMTLAIALYIELDDLYGTTDILMQKDKIEPLTDNGVMKALEWITLTIYTRGIDEMDLRTSQTDAGLTRVPKERWTIYSFQEFFGFFPSSPDFLSWYGRTAKHSVDETKTNTRKPEACSSIPAAAFVASARARRYEAQRWNG